AVKFANYSASAGELVVCDCSSALFTVTLPSAPADKTQVAVKIVLGGNGVTLACGGTDVFNRTGGATSFTLELLAQGAIAQYQSSTGIWFLIASNFGLSQLDARYQALLDGKSPALLLSSGEETLSRDLAKDTASITSTQTLRLTYFVARKSETTTQVRIISGSTAAAATPTLCRIGLYSIDGSGNGTLVASIASDTALFAATNTAYTRSWSSSYAKVAGQRYALGVLVVSSAALPTIAGIAFATAAGTELGIDPRLTGSIGAQADLPSTFTAGSVAVSPSRMYAAILP
ncbi:MAG TPA: hypothetical protein VIQ30_24295, partial [Pseudonocardia sp.]